MAVSTPQRRRRRRRGLLGVVGVLAAAWIIATWQPPEPRPRTVDDVRVVDNSRSGVLLLGWEADRCERLTASSTAVVQDARLVLDLVTIADNTCMAQEPVGPTDPVQRWRMLEAIVVDGPLDALGADRDVVQVACQQDDVTGCGEPVLWRS